MKWSRRDILLSAGSLIAAQGLAKRSNAFWHGTPIIGTLYNKSSWANLNDFTVQNGVATLSGSSVLLSTSTQDTFYNNFTITSLPGTGYSNDENITIALTAQYTGAGDGIGIGFQSVSEIYPIGFVFQFAPNQNPNLINLWNPLLGSNNLYSTNNCSGANMNSGDIFTMTLVRQATSFTCTVHNQTQNITNTFSGICNLAVPTANFNMPNSWQLSIYGFGGSFLISKITASSSTFSTPTICCIGDSKTEGFAAGLNSQRWASLIGSLGSVSVQAVGGGITQDILNDLPYTLAYIKPTYWIVNIGRNDVGNSVPSSTYGPNYSNIITQIRAAGGTVIHLLPIPETSLDQSTLKNYITSTYPSDGKIDVTSTFNTSTDLAGDGIHPNPAGEFVIAEAIVTSGLL